MRVDFLSRFLHSNEIYNIRDLVVFRKPWNDLGEKREQQGLYI